MSTHTGRPTVRTYANGRVAVLCPHGHVLHSLSADEWAGSELEALCGSPQYVVVCGGAL